MSGLIVISIGITLLLTSAESQAGCADCPQPVPFANADQAHDRLPEACMDASPGIEQCLDALVARYYPQSSLGAMQSTAEHRGERLVRYFAAPLSLRLQANAERQFIGFDGAAALGSEWQTEANRFYNHPRPQPISEVVLSIDRGGIVTQPMRSPMHFRATDLVYAFWHGNSPSKRQIMSCSGSLAWGGVEAGIADGAETMSALSDRDRDLLKACLYSMLGAPIPSWFHDDAELHRAVLVATAFRSCVQALLPGDTYRIQKVTEDPAALRVVGTCMQEDLAG